MTRNKAGKSVSFATIVAVCAAMSAMAGVAAAHPCPAAGSLSGLGLVSGSTITKRFSPGAGGLHEPEWRVSFGFATGKGLYVTGAAFRKHYNDPWIQVLYDARLSDIFVPYHTGSPRYYDLSGFGFNLVNATAADAGPCGQVLGGKVVHRVNNHELAWKNDTQVRYREELVLWGTLDAANYNYVMSYGFRDDGTIALRIGATAANLPSRPYESHMHNGLWRIDMDLNGWPSDSAYWMTHKEPSFIFLPPKATDSMPPFNGGVEGAAAWDAKKFNHVLIRDQATNARGHNIGYEFMPVRMGRAVHMEPFSKADFWVTRYNGAEMSYPAVLSYANGQSIMNADLVVWHMSPMHHEPRDEDGFQQGFFWNGVALIMWSGLDIRPRNLWDRTPLYP